MNHWHFILGAYGVTILLMLVEAVALRSRRRNAIAAAQASLESASPT
jgi:hypothetical protein